MDQDQNFLREHNPALASLCQSGFGLNLFLENEMRIQLKSKRAFVFGWTWAGRRASEAGSLIIEALVAGVILALVVVSLYGAFSLGFTSIRLAQENVRADQILVDKLETLRVYDWSKITGSSFIPTNFTTAFSPAAPTGAPSASRAGTIYTGTIAVTNAPLTESYGDTLRQVTVTLQWNSSGVARSRSMTTFVSQNGIQTYKP